MARSSTPVGLAPSMPALTLRSLRTHADFAACVELQRETWGVSYGDCVPASVLKVSQLVGGVCGGAFTPDGRLAGFVYGLTGTRDGRLIHWSHMLAVAPGLRDRGLGRRLKEYQRDVLRGMGVDMMYWTFDPLVARNAHLNLNRLGTQVQEYVPDMYGETGSDLHAFGTDRFVVSWSMAQNPVVLDAPPAWYSAPLVAVSADGQRNGAEGGERLVRIEIPADVEAMSTHEAQGWREATRPVFVRLLDEGYRVAGFISDNGMGRYYVLSRQEAAAGG